MGLVRIFAIALASTLALASASDPKAARRDKSPTETAAPSSATVDFSALSSQLASYVSEISIPPLFPKPTATFAIDIPPTLQGPIITAVPPGILLKLLNTEYRQSVSSEFAAGNTPAWYKSIDPDVKDFLSNLNEDIKTNGSSIYSTIHDEPTATEDVETSTSSDLAAPTHADRRLLAGLVGVVGLALAV